MIVVEKFTMQHAEVLCPVAMESEYWKDDDWRKWSQVAIDAGPAYVGMKNDKPIAACGVITKEGKAWLWGMFSETIKECKKDILRSVRIMLPLMAEEHHIKEMWTLSSKAFVPAHRLLKHLGFEQVRDNTHVLRF